MILFCKPVAEKVHAPGLSGGENSHFTTLARCARGSRATARLTARSSWQGGSFAPRCIPRTRAFRPWTRPKALRPLDFRPGALHRPGPLPAVSPAASTRRAFVPSMDLQTKGDFALPLDTHRPAVRRLDPRQGFRAPGPRTGGRAAPVPLPNPGRIGYAAAPRAAKTTTAPCTAWTARLGQAHTGARCL
jgi:hypothetical protein